jgi:hypothetical protein
MFITELDVVNDCLASLGESPLNAVTEDHPYVAAAVRMLRQANSREQAKGWWFNRELVELHPDPSTGYVYVPEDTINVDPSDPWTNLVQRGRRLYNPASNNPYVINQRIVCNLIRRIPFEDLPPLAQTYISLSTQKDFQKSYDADRFKYEQIVSDKNDAFRDLRAEDIRNVGANLLYKPSTLGRMQALGLLDNGHQRLSTDYGPTSGQASPVSPPAVVDPDTPVPDFVDVFTDALD